MKKNKVRKIAIVEDNPVYRSLVKGILEDSFSEKKIEIAVEVFNHAEGLLESIKRHEYKPDLIIADYDLSGPFQGRAFMNGGDLLKTINAILPNTKVLILSAHNDKDIIESALRNNAFDYIIKDDSATVNLVNRVAIALFGMEQADEIKSLHRLKIGLGICITIGLILAYLTV